MPFRVMFCSESLVRRTSQHTFSFTPLQRSTPTAEFLTASKLASTLSVKQNAVFYILNDPKLFFAFIRHFGMANRGKPS